METKNAIIAIVLSMAILLGYQHFFVPKPPVAVPPPVVALQPVPPSAVNAAVEQSPVPGTQTFLAPGEESATRTKPARDINVNTSLFTAVISAVGGGIKSFKLKDYRKELAEDSDPVDLVNTSSSRELPLFFSWGTNPAASPVNLFEADKYSLVTPEDGSKELVLSAVGSGTKITKSLTFHDKDYVLEYTVAVTNISDAPLQGAANLSLVSQPFTNSGSNRFSFTGPALFLDGKLKEVKVKDLKEDGDKSFKGVVGWAAYEDTYFTLSVVPLEVQGKTAVRMSLSGEDKVTASVSSDSEIIKPGASRLYKYLVYFGPKKVANLKAAGHDLGDLVNFGWFDFLGKPTLYILNFLNKYINNYGIAIILVTILFKLLFWPISQKGMKSMKTMQRIQPKMKKMREKYKDDKERQNKEMMELYKTYKVNPLGGCLPMVLQIPVFFALYRVLMQAIELRHAPFMLWITDLSAPDRLFIGFNLPMVGGLPVLTLLMGASMFMQQKMTPSTGDPTQAKVMMFMPVIFTFMFLNFASGLVLYWFVNNLLSMLQQYLINKQVAAEI